MARYAIVLAASLAVSAAHGQSGGADAASRVTAKTLLEIGFEIVATNYLDGSIILTLQRGDRAFFCELEFDGSSVQCIEIK